jgi:HTH-type transcriptional regulator, competence development regulator
LLFYAYICQNLAIQNKQFKMSNQFGSKIRLLREENNLLLRQVAPFIDMDTPLLSKIERGERQLKKEAIPALAKILNTDENELTTLWLADQLYEVIQGEPMADEALKSVSKKIKRK